MKRSGLAKSLFLAFSLALTFTFAESVSAQDTVTYNCDGANLRADFSAGKVRLRYGTQDVTLNQVQSGSGANYEGKDMKFSTQGKEAMLESPVLSATCKEKSSSSSSGGGNKVKVSDVYGANVTEGGKQMRAKGFKNVSSDTKGKSVYLVWWNAKTKQCVEIEVLDDIFNKINEDASDPSCR